MGCYRLNLNNFPELNCLTDHIPRLLQGLGDWSLNHVFSSKSKVAYAIADSVINNHLTQSYVATGGPRWLAHTIQLEGRLKQLEQAFALALTSLFLLEEPLLCSLLFLFPVPTGTDVCVSN